MQLPVKVNTCDGHTVTWLRIARGAIAARWSTRLRDVDGHGGGRHGASGRGRGGRAGGASAAHVRRHGAVGGRYGTGGG